MIRRREFITLLGGASAAWPMAARAQQGERVRRIGVLMYWAEDDAEGQARLAAFAQALKQLGWSDGRNVRLDTRWASAADIRRHAAELVALAPDVLVAATGTATTASLLEATGARDVLVLEAAAIRAKRTQQRPDATITTSRHSTNQLASGVWIPCRQITPSGSLVGMLVCISM
jgi:hypothetical protein